MVLAITTAVLIAEPVGSAVTGSALLADLLATFAAAFAARPLIRRSLVADVAHSCAPR